MQDYSTKQTSIYNDNDEKGRSDNGRDYSDEGNGNNDNDAN